MSQIRDSRTAAKAEIPRVGEVRMELRRDLQFAAQTRVAEAVARLEPFEPEPLKRAKTFAPGLVNAIYAAIADVPDDEAMDRLVMGLAQAGIGANVVQEAGDGPALAEAVRRAIEQFAAAGPRPSFSPPSERPDPAGARPSPADART